MGTLVGSRDRDEEDDDAPAVGAALGAPGQRAAQARVAGFPASAAAAHVEERLIQMQTGHRTLPTYVRDGCLFHNDAAALVGL